MIIIVDMFTMGVVHATVRMWRPENSSVMLILPLHHHTSSKDGTQVARHAE